MTTVNTAMTIGQGFYAAVKDKVPALIIAGRVCQRIEDNTFHWLLK